jgi:hypothetical protein
MAIMALMKPVKPCCSRAGVFITACIVLSHAPHMVAAHEAASLGPPLGMAPEPYSPLNGGAFSGTPQPLSPDPLVAYEWKYAGVNRSLLQAFTARPVSVTVVSGSGCHGADTLATDAPHATFTGACRLRLDFGVSCRGGPLPLLHEQGVFVAEAYALVSNLMLRRPHH